MSSEVLRRKLFKTVLSDSRSPSGILASSPEMVETVQRRAQGGVNTGDAQYIQAIGQLAQQGDKATLQNIFADTRLPTTVRNAAREALGSLATKTVSSPTADFLSTSGQQLARMPKEAASDAMSDAAGFGQGILDAAASENRKFVDSIKTAAGNDIDRLSSLLGSLKGTGEVARPGPTTTQTREASGLAALLGPQFDAADPRTEAAMAAATPGEEGLPSMLPNSPLRPSVRSPFTPGPLETDEDIVDDEYTSMTPVTPGEEIASTQTPTQKKAAEEAGVVSEKTKVIKPTINQSKLNGMLQQAAAGTLLSDSGKTKVKLNADEAATPQAAAVFAEMVTPEETSLSEMQDKAKDIMGFDPDKAKGDKKDAFWRNLTMAGLAIAAGESDNALSNVAKGLMVGLDSYSKDIKDISAQDAELQKEYRATVRDLVKTDKDEKIAMANIENNFNVAKAEFEQKQNEFESTQDYRNTMMGIERDKFNKQMIVTLRSTLANLEIQRDTLALKQETLDETVAQNAITNRVNELKNEPDFVKVARSLGYVDEKGEWTEEGLSWRAKTTDDAIMDLQLVRSKSTTGQALVPTRFAQEVLKTEDGRSSISFEMIQAFPDQYSDKNPPTLAQMQDYVANSASGGQPQAQVQSAVSDIPKITTKEEYDNLPSGAEFLQNGQRRRKP